MIASAVVYQTVRFPPIFTDERSGMTIARWRRAAPAIPAGDRAAAFPACAEIHRPIFATRCHWAATMARTTIRRTANQHRPSCDAGRPRSCCTTRDRPTRWGGNPGKSGKCEASSDRAAAWRHGEKRSPASCAMLRLVVHSSVAGHRNQRMPQCLPFWALLIWPAAGNLQVRAICSDDRADVILSGPAMVEARAA